jgi:hypothetical protein
MPGLPKGNSFCDNGTDGKKQINAAFFPFAVNGAG